MNRRRLEHLRDCLQQARYPLQMLQWVKVRLQDFPQFKGVQLTPSKADNLCGFAACALGHAALYPPLRKAGLGVMIYRYGCSDITFNGRMTFDTISGAAEFFDISPGQSQWLFSPASYHKSGERFLYSPITHQDVIDRVEALLEMIE